MNKIIGAFFGFIFVFGLFAFANWGIDFESMGSFERAYIYIVLMASTAIGYYLGDAR